VDRHVGHLAYRLGDGGSEINLYNFVPVSPPPPGHAVRVACRQSRRICANALAGWPQGGWRRCGGSTLQTKRLV
jgi:hypothetical protein